MALTSLDTPLESLAKQGHWIDYHRYMEICNIWKAIVTHDILINTDILSISQDIVYIATSSSGWSQELSFQQYSLLKKINQHLLVTSINKLHFSSAKWSEKKLFKSPPYKKEKACFFSHKNSYSSVSKITIRKDETAQEAFEKWTMAVKNKLTSFSICPKCQRPASLRELQRWSKCYLCIR
ncbi:DciA family protein [Candidatus Atelocyanobacterium thalassae]|uniref:DUF721 domain-containing protein n=2 Tax=Candidatus Atelocyanobacterium thalassae TaxID=713887 RepID=A0ABN6JZM3_9CHRO|nr:DUF721 domain-containing protein [Candidatus Atelocyanobacterium thalassa]KFF42100.1 MAG: putative RNA-binding protein containing Zn ribbon [Candidatus Atelocyanobacterium thalassa isolate SIO64986]BDA39912.1 hypothetical protein CPARK_000075200 [cyanobacterium endosymbiont of Braarudosphaera bigelowii]